MGITPKGPKESEWRFFPFNVWLKQDYQVTKIYVFKQIIASIKRIDM